jgi:Tfp pilus assembly protein PilF
LFTLLFFAQAAASTPAPPPASFETEFRSGLMALQRNDPGAAQQSLERALQLKPENAQAWAALAQAYLRGKQSKPAASAAQRAEQLGAADPVTQHALAIFYSEARDLPRAADWERRFASSPIADPNAAARAAALSLDAGDPQQAIAWAKTALGRKDSAEVHHLLANAYEAAKQPDPALEEFRSAARLAPDNEAFTFDFGNCVLRRGDFSAALGIFDEARRRFAKSAQVELAYGVAAYGARQFPDAIASFLHVTELDPSVEQPYVFMGRILDQGGDRLPRIVAAYAAWEKANPESYLPPLLHAKALSASAGDAAAIEVELRRSIKLNGAYWESHLELGMQLAKKRQWQDAAAELARSIELNPKEPRAHFQLARAYDRLGERVKAEAERAIHEQLTASETDVHGAKDPIKP